MRTAITSVLILALTACEGTVVTPRNGSGIIPVDPTQPVADGPELPAPSSRAARLSHVEYENTARDMLGATAITGLTSSFLPDVTSSTFTNNGGDLTVTADQWTDYQTAAEELARRATVNDAALTAATGGTLPPDAAGIVAALGRRAFRRALTADEQAAYVTLYGKGPTWYAAQSSRLAGSRVVLEALLQSPYFLYRVELTTGSGKEVPLSANELAQRLSYALWQSMPDEALLDAAEGGALLDADAYGQQVERMLMDPRTASTLQVFHAELLGQSKYSDITRSTTLFPEFSVELRESMKQEQVRFLDAVILGGNGGLAKLLTEPSSFVDQRLARVYGLTGTFDNTFQKVTLTGGKRAGLFTQVGFLAANATSTESDPIHRGVFLNHKILCADLPAPPNNVPPLPRPDPSVPKTLRTRITEFTGVGTCGAGCHSTMINPAGFAFENFDALGRWRDTDNGLPVDAKDSYSFQGNVKSYDGAVAIQDVIAKEPMAHDCYSQHWVEFLLGRAYDKIDKPLVKRAGRRSLNEGLPVTQLLRVLVESGPFKSRPGDAP